MGTVTSSSSDDQRHVHGSVDTRLGVAALRDLRPDDIGAVVRYWHESDDEYLDRLGIDRARLGSPADTEQRYRRAIRTGDAAQPAIAFAITLGGRFVGYTLLNQYSPEVNHSHWHLTDPMVRAAGLSTALYPYRMRMYFAVAPIARLVHQTRTRNVGVNRMLDRFVPVAETRYIDNPDGVALPGEFHVRYVRREDVPHFFELARTLA